jgi:hypothetical protein
MWVPPEIKDPILRHAPTRKSVACFGAVSLSTGQFVRTENGDLLAIFSHRTQSQTNLTTPDAMFERLASHVREAVIPGVASNSAK